MKLSYLFFSFENSRLQIKGMLKKKSHFDKVKIRLKYFIMCHRRISLVYLKTMFLLLILRVSLLQTH